MKMTDQAALGASVALGASRQFEFEVEHEGARGRFTFHRPTMKERLTIGVLEATNLGQVNRMSVDIITRNIAHIMATFSVVLDDRPAWFNLDVIDDYDLLEKVYLKYEEVVNPFRGGAGQTNQEGGGTT